MTAARALAELLIDLRECAKSLDELRVDYLRKADRPTFERGGILDRQNAERLSHKLAGLRLAISRTDILYRHALADEAEAGKASA